MNNKAVIFYGAFDRYNFGDNLMPIVLEEYFKLHSMHEEYDFKFASISESDLSQYDCKKTVAINNLIKNDNRESVLVVVGGEVLGARLGTLFTHVQTNPSILNALKFINRFAPQIVTLLSQIFYPCRWEYPYVPGKDHFKGKIIYNTVGGRSPKKLINKLSESIFISARDERTHKFFRDNEIGAELVPDSVLMISDLFDKHNLADKVRPGFAKRFLDRKYIVVQVCPYKQPCTEEELAVELKRFNSRYPDYEIILLPIGYASGHDDVIYLSKLHNLIPDISELQYELTVWEILFVIANSSAFYGTSLHGVITAMSYNVPYFSINEKIHKISSFLSTWSIAPLDKPISYNEIVNFFDVAKSIDNSKITQNSKEKIMMIKSSIDKMIYRINQNYAPVLTCS